MRYFGFILFLFIIGSSEFTLNAQTIYHYKKTATVDHTTGVKKQSSYGESLYATEYIHIIFENDYEIYEVNENGSRYKSFYPENNIYFEYYPIGEKGKYKYDSNDNNFIVYHCEYGYRQVHKTSNDYLFNWDKGDANDNILDNIYLYISDDKHKLNKRCKEKSPINGKEYWGNIYVYELYDTDEKGAMPTTKQDDPSHPITIY